MTEKVLTDEEKDALLEGVASGDVEVQSGNGRSYASVTDFQVPPRAHIVRDSYPRLKLLNNQVAERIGRDVEQLLQRDVSASAADLSVKAFGGICEALPGPMAAIVFEAAPLSGKGLIVLPPATVRLLVDTFFGGDGNDAQAHAANSFTAGELSVSNLFSNIVLNAISETWAPMLAIVTERVSTEVSMELADIVTEVEPVIDVEYEIVIGELQGAFHVLLPVDMLQPLLPVFEGQKGNRDLAEDARWAQVIKRRLADAVINLTSRVGHARLPLGDLAKLVPGDVIEIEQPQTAVVMASNIRLIQGRLGVHRGRNAIETVEWIDPQQADLANTGN